MSPRSGDLLKLALALTLAVIAHGSAHALCPTQTPLTDLDAEGDPLYYNVICVFNPGGLEPPPPCPKPAAPTVLPSSVRSQGMTLQATVPNDIASAHAVWWTAEYLSDTGELVTLWIERSVQGIGSGGLVPGTNVEFGAPGLVENGNHYFRVTFEDATGLKMCWSPRTSATTTTGFATCPTPPSGLYVKVEDDFDRPETDPVHGTPAGDGIGPDEVWTPSDSISPTHPIRIAEDEESALAVPTSNMVYERLQETDHKSYAETEIRVDLARSAGTSFAYNYQMQARMGQVDPSTGQAPSVAVKLIKGPRQCTQPSLLIFQLPEEYTITRCTADGSAPEPPIGGTICTDAPPLDIEDPNEPGLSYPVWLRIEVENNYDKEPVVTGTAYWWDSGGAYQECMASRVFVGDPYQMVDVEGRWGVSFHDKHYRVGTFCAGDGTAP